MKDFDLTKVMNSAACDVICYNQGQLCDHNTQTCTGDQLVYKYCTYKNMYQQPRFLFKYWRNWPPIVVTVQLSAFLVIVDCST